ncbi:MAG: hypothetical protein KDA42_10325 [Planctomycetales bacterium]|nr:hypothetical protein [Planctomycetales bacterium]
MAEASARATITYDSGKVPDVLEFLKRTRSELRSLTHVRVSVDWFRVFDVNGDYFEVTGIGYGDEPIVEILRFVNTAFKPEFIHAPITGPYKEFKTGRRYCWAQDRVM